jgi:hypothetical protein
MNGNRRLGVVGALALVAVIALGAGAQVAQAGYWYINPYIYNQTQSTADNCPDGVTGTGCIFLQESGLDDGDWLNDPEGGSPGGRGAVANNNDNLDIPAFDAPHDLEGADGFFNYTMPDGAGYGLFAADDENGLGVNAAASAGCGMVNPGTYTNYACLAGIPTNNGFGTPSNSNFAPTYSFQPWWYVPLTAAGQTCNVDGSTTANCTTGRACPYVTSTDCPTASGNGGWSNTDPDNYMVLEFQLTAGSGPVSVTDRAAWYNDDGAYFESCSLSQGSNTCWITTSGGCANNGDSGAPGPGGCGTDALQVQNSGSDSASVQVIAEAEVPSDLAEGSQAAIFSMVGNDIDEAVTGGCGTNGGYGCPGARRPPRLSGLSAGYRSSQGVRVSYRAATSKRTLVTLARASSGGRWVMLPKRRLANRFERRWMPRGNAPCPKGTAAGTPNGLKCRRVFRRFAHARHEDRPGRNTWRFGRGLAPGRYRLTATAYDGARKSRPVRTEFTVRG